MSWTGWLTSRWIFDLPSVGLWSCASASPMLACGPGLRPPQKHAPCPKAPSPKERQALSLVIIHLFLLLLLFASLGQPGTPIYLSLLRVWGLKVYTIMLFLMGLSVYLSVCLCTTCVQEPIEVRREHWIPWSWSFRWSWATKWVLGIKSGSSVRIVRLILKLVNFILENLCGSHG